MHMRKVLVGICFLGHAVFAESSIFKNLQDQFSRSSAPQQKESLGAWAGFCVQADEADRKWPAVYVHTGHVDAISNVEVFSQTYFWEKKEPVDFFAQFSWNQLQSYVPYVNWTQREQWQPTQIISDALTNVFTLPNGGAIIRSVRLSETEFSRTFLMEVNRKTVKGEEVISMCAFSHAIPRENAISPGPTVSIQTGPLSHTYAEVKLPMQSNPMKTLVIQKRPGESVVLSEVQLVLDNGKVLHYDAITFSGGEAVALQANGPFRAQSIRFYVMGSVSSLWLYGSTSPSHHQQGELVP